MFLLITWPRIRKGEMVERKVYQNNVMAAIVIKIKSVMLQIVTEDLANRLKRENFNVNKQENNRSCIFLLL